MEFKKKEKGKTHHKWFLGKGIPDKAAAVLLPS